MRSSGLVKATRRRQDDCLFEHPLVLTRKRIFGWMGAALLITGLGPAIGVPGKAQSKPGVAPDQILTLRQALDIALQNNRLIAMSGLQVEQARQRVAQIRTELLPQLNIQALGGELLGKVTAHFPAGVLGTVNGSPVPSQATNVSTSDRFSTVYSLTVAQPLTQIPRIRTGIRLQKLGVDSAHEQERQQRLTIAANVRQNYYALMQIREGIRATNAGLTALQELERSIADSVVQQSALRADLLEVQARVAVQEAALSTQLDTLQQYTEQMNLLLGRDVRTPFQVAPETAEPLSDMNVEQLRAQALSDHPDLRRSALQIGLAEQDQRNTRLGYLPDLSLAMSYSGIGSGINGLPDHFWTAGFLFSWKAPWDWGRRRHEIAEKTLAIRQAELAYAEAKSAAQVDVNNQIRREHAAQDDLHAAQTARAAAQERLRVTMDQYHAREVLIKDVLQAQAALANTDRQVQDAALAYRTAQSELRRALGQE